MTCTRMDCAYSFTVTLSVHMCASCTTERFTTTIMFSLFVPLFPIGTFIGVGVGVSMFLLLVLLTSVVVLILVVVVRRKGANKQKRKMKMGDNLYNNIDVMVEQEMEMKENSVVTDCKDADCYQDVDNDKDEEDDPLEDGFNQYAVVDRKEHIKSASTPAPMESSTSTSATNGSAVYAVVDKSKKKGAKKTGDEPMLINKDELYAKPIKKEDRFTDRGQGSVVSGGVEEGEQYDDTVGYKPKVDSEP